MSVIVRELNSSRKRKLSFDGADLSLDFIALGSSDDSTVYAAVYLSSPATYAVVGAGGRTFRLRRKDISLTPVGAGVWTAEATYGIQIPTADGAADPQDMDDATPAGPELSFDTTGGTEHITQSLATVSSTAATGVTAPDYKLAIGVTRDSVAGVDRVSPKFEFTLTVPKVGLARSYVRDLARNTGKMNSASWNGYAAGEVLFLGATGQAKPADGFTITYKFAVQENRTNQVITGSQLLLTGLTTASSTTIAMLVTTGINVGDRIYGDGIPSGATVSSVTPGVSIVISAAATVSGSASLTFGSATGIVIPFKRGWDYVWCAYKDTTSSNILVQIPVAAYVEQIYRSFNFTTVLGF